ncbi:TRAP transporter small permease [Aliiruegeria sabulilitoris]|uniref:TRAP transporter small permease n=1 Tax=Aliiruegeria sabulilitoris TaxID=1510458 RepID=UPI000835E916|nr:TRAP transporter small permease [Aliiruegeria sabulilitoris]NDR56252.1 TRAP transporter small permease [Pseudoruegeria sp. M32A2M]
MRRVLDTLYTAAGGLAALSILAICLLVSAQVGLNILARIGGPALSYTIPSYADFAGFALAAASFLAMAYTLRAGAHIRVNLLVSRLPKGGQWVAEMVSLALGAAMVGYATWFSVQLLLESLHYGDTSPGIIAVPLWIPQLTMVTGLVLLTVALLDTLVQSVRNRAPVIIDFGSE